MIFRHQRNSAMSRFWLSVVIGLFLLVQPASAQTDDTSAEYVRKNYTRQSHKIAMRDGAHLHTTVYSPRDTSKKYPLIMTRTPYGIGPYDEKFHRFSLGPNKYFAREGYIFVYQDVRGC